MKSNKTILLSIGALFFLGVLVLRPVPIVEEHEAITTSGIVEKIAEMGDQDIFFKLKNDHRRYYINRGLERGLELSELESSLIGNQVTLKYPKYWTPLDWNNNIRHISKLEKDNQVIFTEFN